MATSKLLFPSVCLWELWNFPKFNLGCIKIILIRLKWLKAENECNVQCTVSISPSGYSYIVVKFKHNNPLSSVVHHRCNDLVSPTMYSQKWTLAFLCFNNFPMSCHFWMQQNNKGVEKVYESLSDLTQSSHSQGISIVLAKWSFLVRQKFRYTISSSTLGSTRAFFWHC